MDHSVIYTDYADRLQKFRRMIGVKNGGTVQARLGVQPKTTRTTVWSVLVHAGMRMVKDVVCFPDEQVGWFRPALRAAEAALRSGSYDAIISTSFPVTAHVVASQLHRRFGIPWVADLRDLWADNHYLQFSAPRQIADNWLERRILGQAQALTTVSEPLADQLRRKYPGKLVRAIENGFDPNEYGTATYGRHDQLTITYAGQLLEGKRDPEPVFKAIRELIDEGLIDEARIRVQFAGWFEPWLANMVERYRLSSVVQVLGFLPREEILRLEVTSDILLLISWNHPGDAGVFTGKIFEYLGARRPILAIGGPPDGVVGELLGRCRAGWHVDGVGPLKDVLLQQYLNFRSECTLPFYPLADQVHAYSQVQMATRFGALLDLLVEGGTRHR